LLPAVAGEQPLVQSEAADSAESSAPLFRKHGQPNRERRARIIGEWLKN
jgi:hypothetical protein